MSAQTPQGGSCGEALRVVAVTEAHREHLAERIVAALADATPAPVETWVEWGVRFAAGAEVACRDEVSARSAAAVGGTLVRRTVAVGAWEVAE